MDGNGGCWDYCLLSTSKTSHPCPNFWVPSCHPFGHKLHPHLELFRRALRIGKVNGGHAADAIGALHSKEALLEWGKGWFDWWLFSWDFNGTWMGIWTWAYHGICSWDLRWTWGEYHGFNLKIMRISWAYHGNINENDTTNWFCSF